jgi:hypothetical protein
VFTVTISGIIALGALVYAGFLFMVSGANPGLRATAKKKITDVLWGLLLLLGAYIFFNTLNPDLTTLRTTDGSIPPITKGQVPDLPPLLGSPISPDSLLYGGIVIYEELPGDGSSGGSEILFSNVSSFNNELWPGPERMYMKLLGNCTIATYTGENYAPVAAVQTGPFTWAIGLPQNSLKFINRDCIGSSITAYMENDYKSRNYDFIYSDLNLVGDVLTGNGLEGANDKINSVRFNRPDLKDFSVSFCNDVNMDPSAPCADVFQSDIDGTALDTLLGGVANFSALTKTAPLAGMVSSFRFLGEEQRQAGVILYNHDKFEGASEIFITSDKQLDGSTFPGDYNIIHESSEYTSSIRIVGEYIVTLYDCINFCETSAGHYLTFYNWATPEPYFEQGPIPPPIGIITRQPLGESFGKRVEATLEIPLLKSFVHPSGGTWGDDKIKSIRLELPRRIYDGQKLSDENCNILVHPSGDLDEEFCELK